MTYAFPRIDAAQLVERVKDRARLAGRVARAVTISAGNFLGGCAVVAAAGAFAGYEVLQLRKPDAVLLHQAIANAHDAATRAAFAAAHPSVIAERDTSLMLLAVAVLCVVAGIGWLVEWRRALPLIKKAAE